VNQDIKFEYKIVSFDKETNHVTVQILCKQFLKERQPKYNIGLNGLTSKDDLNDFISNYCLSIVERTLLAEDKQRSQEIEEFVEHFKNEVFPVSIKHQEIGKRINSTKTLSVPRETKITNPKSFEVVI
jgi:hypothetical protein